MISSRYRYRPVTVPLPFLGLIKHRYLTITSPLPYRYLTLLTLPTVTHRYPPLPTVTHRYSSLLIVTHRYSPLPLLTVFLEIWYFFHFKILSFKIRRILKLF